MPRAAHQGTTHSEYLNGMYAWGWGGLACPGVHLVVHSPVWSLAVIWNHLCRPIHVSKHKNLKLLPAMVVTWIDLERAAVSPQPRALV